MNQTASPSPASRPNILLITSDQHRADCFGFEGRRRVNTPNLDKLAQSGTRFSTAITPNVVCQPSRASILTGLLPLTHGAYDNHVNLDPQIAERGWSRTLASAGYRSGFIGKAHFGEHSGATIYGAPESRDASAGFPTDWSGPYMGFDEVELMILGHWHKYLPCEEPPRGHHFERWFWGHGEHGEAWRLWSEAIGPRPMAAQTWTSALPAQWHSTTWVTQQTQAFLQNQDAAQPFCLWASFPDPHHSFDCPLPWADHYHADDVDISTTHARDLDKRPWWHRASLESMPTPKSEKVLVLRQEYSRLAPQTDRQLAEMTANYYGMISFIDDGVGKILATLKSSGLADNTIVIFTSDHGELLGDHGLYLKGPTHYESLLRVGLVASGPGIASGAVVSEPVSTLDLAPTILEAAQVDIPDAMQGQSLIPLLAGKDQTRDFAYNEWNMHPSRTGVSLELRTVRTKMAKLTIDQMSGAGELYDLANDPDEMINRFDDPGFAVIQKELMQMIASRPGAMLETLPCHGQESPNASV
ncbi:MAG: sulfatase-like hydrolase/transferase [Burkholderiaceae bacterium]